MSEFELEVQLGGGKIELDVEEKNIVGEVKYAIAVGEDFEGAVPEGVYATLTGAVDGINKDFSVPEGKFTEVVAFVGLPIFDMIVNMETGTVKFQKAPASTDIVLLQYR